MDPQPRKDDDGTTTEKMRDGETAAEYAYRTADEWAQGDPFLAQAQRALLDGSARKLLKEEFARSGMDAETLGKAVSHSPLVVRSVINGRGVLSVYTVAEYLRAMHG